MKEEIKLYDLTETEIAETIELGDEVYNKLVPIVERCLNENKRIVIDFSGIKSLTTKFLNNAIGNLLINLDIDKILASISFIGLDSAKKTTLRWSLNTAIKSVSRSKE